MFDTCRYTASLLLLTIIHVIQIIVQPCQADLRIAGVIVLLALIHSLLQRQDCIDHRELVFSNQWCPNLSLNLFKCLSRF